MSLPDDFVPGQVITAAALNAIKDEVALKLDEASATATYALVPTTITASATAVKATAVRTAPVSRSVTDGVAVAGSTTITSATAAFTAGDVGSYVVGSHIPQLATITAVTNGTTATISAPAALAGTGRTWTIVKPITVTLPTGEAGDRLAVVKGDALLAVTTIAAPGGGSVNGGASVALSSPRGRVDLLCTAAGVWLADGAVDAREQGPVTFRAFPVIRATDTHGGNDAQVIGKAPGSGTVGTVEAWHNDTQGNIFHLNCGPGMVGNADSAAINGYGCDYEGSGSYYHVRATGGGGKGIRIGMDNGLTWANSRGLVGSIGSGAGVLAEFIQSPATTASGAAAQFWAQIAPDSSQKLVRFFKPNTVSAGTETTFVRAIDGYWFYNVPINVTSDVIGAVPLQVTGLTGQTADLARFDVAGTGTLAKIAADGLLTATYLRAQGAGGGLDIYDTGGTANTRRYKIANSSSTLSFQARTDANGSAGEMMSLAHATGNLTLKAGATIAADTTTGLKIGASASKLGFFGATPIVKPTATPAEATDLATALTLLNYLRTNVIVAEGLAA